MRNATVQVYKFEELAEAAKVRARDWYREGLDYVVDDLTDWFKEFLTDKGYEARNVWWSLSYCQGDGVCFEGSIDVMAVARRILDANDLRQVERIAKVADIYGVVTCKERGYWTRIELESDLDRHYGPFKRMQAVIERLQDAIQDDIDDLCYQMKKDGYADIDYQHSDEVVDEGIIANEYEFTEDGRLFR